MYTIKQLCQMAHISQATFYRVSRENSEFSGIVEANRIKRGNSYRYGEPVRAWLLDYYAASVDAKTAECPSAATQGLSDVSSASTDESTLQELKRENEALRARTEQLEKLLDDERAERKELHQQNGHLLLLLSQEKQEKQLLLPAPKKSLRERWALLLGKWAEKAAGAAEQKH